jgi:hypothetical protein
MDEEKDIKQNVEESNARFYKASESLSIEKMEVAWKHSDDTICIHPGWEMFTGWTSIWESWVRILMHRLLEFVKEDKEDNQWVYSSFFAFITEQNTRVAAKEITAATALNSVKTIKLFCEMNDILLPWKRITRGLPKARRYADYRAPTLEEVLMVIVESCQTSVPYRNFP